MTHLLDTHVWIQRALGEPLDSDSQRMFRWGFVSKVEAASRRLAVLGTACRPFGSRERTGKAAGRRFHTEPPRLQAE